MLRTLMTVMALFLTSPAFAHLGHVGEVAGHAHWVGIGAVIVAGALAAAIGKLAQKDGDEDEIEEELELDEEAPVEG